MKNLLKGLSIPQMILVLIITIAVAFGILCATSALLMVLWNFAVVGAIAVCVPIGFWEAMCLQLAVAFLFSHRDIIYQGATTHSINYPTQMDSMKGSHPYD